MTPLKILVCAPEYYPQGSGIAIVAHNVVTMLAQEHEVHVCSPVGPDIVIASRDDRGRFGQMSYWKGVRGWLRDNNSYDAIWLHNPLVPDIGASNCVVTLHSTAYGRSKVSSFPHPYLYYRWFAWHEHRCYRGLHQRGARFTTENTGIVDELRSNGIRDPAFVLNGTDTEKFAPRPGGRLVRERYGVPVDATLLISVGRITAIKNPLYQLRLMESLGKENVHLLMAGGGEMFDRCKAYLADRKVENVHMVGKVPYDDLPELYACADLFLMTSLYEGLPLTLLEAMSSSLPCIVPDISGTSIVRMADCGLQIGCKDPERDAALVRQLMTDDIGRYAANARRYAVEHFDWERIAQLYLDEFKKVVP